MNKIIPTEQQLRIIRDGWDVIPRKELCKKTNLSYRIIYRVAAEQGLQVDNTPRNKIVLSEQERDYLVRNFHKTDNEELASELGISHSTLHRMARNYGLKKSNTYLRMQTKERSGWLSYYFKKTGKRPPVPKGPNAGSFKPGVTSLERLGLVGERMRIAASTATRKKNIARDRMRIAEGLEPLHNKHLVNYNSRQVTQYTYYLKKHGYQIDKEARKAYYNDLTQRAPRLEARRDFFYTFEQAR